MERSDAISLLRRHVTDENLIKHCLATGAVMKALALHLNEDASLWELTGILHDIDFQEIGGDMQQHGARGRDILLQHGFDPDFADVVLRHNHFLHGGTYERRVEIGLQAADSVSGLVIACALVKGGNLSAVTAKTVAKKSKERSFAAGCDRNRIALIQTVMDLPLFYDVAIQGLMTIRDELGLT
jgi:putative nucleotidyltransferase with HDIG domain